MTADPQRPDERVKRYPSPPCIRCGRTIDPGYKMMCKSCWDQHNAAVEGGQ